MRLLYGEIFKDRPLLVSAIFLALGIISAYYWRILTLFDFFIIILIGIGIFTFLAIFVKERKRIFFFFIIFLTGFAQMSWQEFRYNSPYSLTNYNSSRNLTVLGVVKEDLSSLQGNKLILKPFYIDNKSVKYGSIQLDKRYLPFQLSNGDLVEIKLNLNEPAREMNPGGFSNYNYLKRKGIYSQGYYSGEIAVRGEIKNYFIDSIIDLKYHLINLIDETGEELYDELLKALLLGERDRLLEDWEESFTQAGINHLLAISGLHIGFIVAIFHYILKGLRLPSGIRNFILSILVILYIILTGFRPSVFRAGLLSVIILWAPFFNRKGDLLNILGLTAFLNLSINPYQLFDIGFQLSYFVLLMILLWYEVLEEYLKPVFSASAAAFLGSSPLTAYYFNLLTPMGLVANLWAIPLAGIIVSLALVGLLTGLIHPVFSSIIFKILIYPVKLLITGSRIMSLIPLGHMEVASPSVPLLIFCIILLILLPFLLKKKIIPYNEKKRKKRLYYLFIFSLLFIFSIFCFTVFNRQLELTFISVGQGDSIFLRTPANRYLLIDGGGFLGQDSTHGEYTVLPYLKYKGIKRLDIVFITHFDADHAMGIIDILANRKVNLLVLPVNYESNEIAEKVITEANKNNVSVILAQEGDYFKIDEVYLRILSPISDYRRISRNENSLVIKVEYGNFTALLTGDLEAEGERRLINNKYPLKSNILKLGHHGSKSSSTEIFLRHVAPEHGIISVGRNNYGHPAEEVLLRSAKYGISLWRTDEQGAIRVRSNGNSYSIEGYLK